MTPQPKELPPYSRVLQMISGFSVASVISCAAHFGIADLLESGPRTIDDLAAATGTNPQALYRLLRAAASVGVFIENPDGKFAQTPLSDSLRTNAQPSARPYARMMGREWVARSWSRLEYSVRTGTPSFNDVHGMPLFEYLKDHPGEAQFFNDAMTSFSVMDSPAIAAAYDFSGIDSIVDVGGGHGLLLATVLAKYPGMRGILFEAAEVIEGAQKGPLVPVMERCSLVAGNMFETVPHGADAYMMKHIIHDWPDEPCIRLLKACRAAVKPGGRLLVLDRVVAPGNEFDPAKFLDMNMMILPSGLERTEAQFRELYAAAGWTLSRIVPTAAPDSVVEGLPV